MSNLLSHFELRKILLPYQFLFLHGFLQDVWWFHYTTWNENVLSKFILHWKLLERNDKLSFLFCFSLNSTHSTVHWFHSSPWVRQSLWQGPQGGFLHTISIDLRLLPGIRRNNRFINYSQGVMEKIWVHWISIIPSFLLSGILLFHLEFFLDVQTRFQEVGWGVERQKRRRERGRAAYLHKVWISQQIPHKGLWYSGPESETENDIKLKWNTVMTQMLPENLPLLVLKSTITRWKRTFPWKLPSLIRALISATPRRQRDTHDLLGV